MTIETLGKWNQQAKMLHELNYFVVTTQYAADSPQGYHVTFMSKNSDKLIEVITHSAEVQNAIYAF